MNAVETDTRFPQASGDEHTHARFALETLDYELDRAAVLELPVTREQVREWARLANILKDSFLTPAPRLNKPTKRLKFGIEKGIPIPQPNKGRSGLVKILRRMEPGDSVFLKADKGRAALARAGAHYCAKSTGFRFATRKLDGGVRIWRVS